MNEVVAKTLAARDAALKLANISAGLKNQALKQTASSIIHNKVRILEAVSRDVDLTSRLVERGKLSHSLLDRLRLNEGKLSDIVKMINSVALLEDPVGKTLTATELDDEFELYKVTCPIGVIGAIFESRPDVLPQISSLCLKSGNAVLLKGGKEARNTNQAFYEIIAKATMKAGIPDGWIQLLDARRDVKELLKLDKYVDLLVPRGSNKFVRYIQGNTNIPVLGHSAGVCHIYVDKEADLDSALEICYDAKVQYPSVCNAVECLLVHSNVASTFLPILAKRFLTPRVEIRGCNRTYKILRDFNILLAKKEDWGREYLGLKIAIRVVDDVSEAVDYINTYSSKHTDAIITKNTKTARRFMEEVDSSTVIHNASTRFSDGFRYGLGAEVGISTGRIHARGPVGLEGLVTSKYYLLGSGQVVNEYTGPDAKKFKHKRILRQWSEARLKS